jgi:oxygen-independent coproporphyrinogen-3 oxidase
VFGVYIHFPYCRKRCPYCDFAVHARQRIPHDRYADAVLHELSVRAPLYTGRRAISIYLGGGTPGLWRADAVARVLDGVRARFGVPIETTVEANPEDLDDEQLRALTATGVNRVSLGVQSLDARHRRVLGRPLDGAEVAAVARRARALVDNLSLDLIFGVPGQTLAELDRDLDGLLELSPDHLSIYNLTIEPRTEFAALHKKGALHLPDGSVQAEMYERVGERLEAAGLEHYEISSWARPGRRAVHNQLYWSGGEYLGLGCSAHSLRRENGIAERFATVRSVDVYFAMQHKMGGAPLNEDPAIALHEQLAADALEREAVWLGLRLVDGIARADHAARHGVDPVARHAAEVARLTGEGLIEVTDERLRLTRRGRLFADEVGARFI